MIKLTSCLLALLGLGLGVWVVVASARQPPVLPGDRPPTTNPFPWGIAAAGVVEAASRNVRIPAPEAELVTEVFVRVNDPVKVGTPLVQLDNRRLTAELGQARAAVEVAHQNLKRLQALPRPEDVRPLRAALERAEAHLAFARREYERAQGLHQQQAGSSEQLSEKAAAVQEAVAARDEARAQLDRTLAGAWGPDLDVARSTLAQAQAEARVIQSRLDRLTVRAPLDGVVLKRHVEPGELLTPGSGPLLVVGDLSVLHVRAQVDERDTPLLREGAAAVAMVIDRDRHTFPLRMLRIEPLAVPKSQLTDSHLELVDTRVVEVIFAAETSRGAAVRLYPGQVVEVYIRAE
jgi:multidrug resistance efflux pump